MSFVFKTKALLIAVAVFVGALGAVVMPQHAAAIAGSGGGGGSSGCSKFLYSTCYGAVWRYYKTSQDPFPITNVGGTSSTQVVGCSATGGFFAYVLVNKSGGGGTRSWKIGPNGGQVMDKSMFFGGRTNYRIASNPSDPLPTNPSNGDYSWYSVEKAFNLTKSLGQNSRYEWNGDSELGWFCYSGIDYSLQPTISANPSAAVTAGGTVSVTGAVNNSGPTQSNPTDWQMSQIIVPKGAALPTGGDNNKDPRSFYGSSGFSTINSGNDTYAAGIRNYAAQAVAISDTLEVGTRVCFVLSVHGYSASSTDWRHSSPSCPIIAKRPISQVIGGDLRVGAAFVGTSAPAASSIQTSVTIKSGKSYGSWGEYGLIASGTIQGAGSASAFSGGVACTSSCPVNNMSFANSASPVGNYKSANNIPDVASSFAVTSATPNFSSLGDASLRRVETANNDITINGGTIQKGDWLVINAPTKTVTIKGDIKYTNTSLQSLSDIPQLIIIANKINIEGNVSQVDAWLVASGATGSINTCSAWQGAAIGVTDRLTSAVCSTSLTINGPVMAKTLYLRRTAGSGTGAQSDDPAEVINFRPDAYLWATSQSSKSSRLETTYSQDLPPRF